MGSTATIPDLLQAPPDSYLRRLANPSTLRMLSDNPGVLDRLPAMSAPQLDAPVSQSLQLPSVSQPEAPSTPQVALPSPTATQSRLASDNSRLNYLRNSGSGVSQILHPVDDQGNPTGQHISPLRRVGGVAAGIGDAALSILAPRVAQYTPGTTGHNLFLQNQTQGRINSDLTDAQQEGTLAMQPLQQEQEKALTQYTTARPDIEQSKIDQRQTAVQERVGQAAAARGQKVTWDANGLPSFTDDTTSQEYLDHQALSAMHQATAEKSAIMGEIAKNHYIPGTPEYAEAQKKIAQKDMQIQVSIRAMQNSAQRLELRKNDQNANFYGVGPDGNALPNAPQFVGDNGEVTTGGLKGAKTAITQQGAVGQFRDLGGSIKRTGNYLDTLHNSGSSLADVRVIDALRDAGEHEGTLTTYLRSNLLKSGLTPEQVNAVAGLASFQEQLNTLRSATKGTGAEAQVQRMLIAAPNAGDTPELANRKMIELQATYDRVAPSVSTIGGGMSLNGKGGKQGNGPKEGDTKVNSAGDKVRFSGGKWGPA